MIFKCIFLHLPLISFSPTPTYTNAIHQQQQHHHTAFRSYIIIHLYYCFSILSHIQAHIPPTLYTLSYKHSSSHTFLLTACSFLFSSSSISFHPSLKSKYTIYIQHQPILRQTTHHIPYSRTSTHTYTSYLPFCYPWVQELSTICFRISFSSSLLVFLAQSKKVLMFLFQF